MAEVEDERLRALKRLFAPDTRPVTQIETRPAIEVGPLDVTPVGAAGVVARAIKAARQRKAVQELLNRMAKTIPESKRLDKAFSKLALKGKGARNVDEAADRIAAEKIRKGMNPDQARREARRVAGAKREITKEKIAGGLFDRPSRKLRRVQQMAGQDRASKKIMRDLEEKGKVRRNVPRVEFDRRGAKRNLRKERQIPKPSIPGKKPPTSKDLERKRFESEVRKFNKENPKAKIKKVDTKKKEVVLDLSKKTSARKTSTRKRTGVGAPKPEGNTKAQRVQGIKNRIIRELVEKQVKRKK